jgi:FkbM family methyltransferase
VAPGYIRVQAIHPNWDGFLLLAAEGNALEHEGYNSRGHYDLRGDALTVHWDAYPPDEFKRVGDRFVHRSIAPEIPEFHHLRGVRLGGMDVPLTTVTVTVPGSWHEVTLRVGSSDGNAFLQVILWNEYECANLPHGANTILDLGANIGLAAVFFAHRFPAARIFSVEPDAGNFALLQTNTRSFGPRVQHVLAAAWHDTGRLSLHAQDSSGAPLGEWGLQVSDQPSQTGAVTACYDVPSLLSMAGFEGVDILKMDIEGAELEVFANGADLWLPRVRLIIAETHDRFRPGSEAAVRAALRDNFEELPSHGENLFFRRKAD